MPKTVLVTVADDRFGRKDGRYRETQLKIGGIFQNCGWNLSHAPYTWDDIRQTAFYLENKILLDNTDAARNGRAYKPFVIVEELKKLADGEYLIYTDCSPELWQKVEMPLKTHFELSVIQNLCAGNLDILTAFIRWDMKKIPPGGLGIATHRNYTLNRCMDTMGLRFYEDAFQCASGMICIRKTDTTLALMEEWLKWNCIDECCALGWAHIERDASFWAAESTAVFGAPGFKMGHRHDQSILGLLLARTNQKFVDFPLNGMHPYNFLQYCRPGMNYKFIESNPPISIGQQVINKQGTELTVFDILEDGQYVVGQLSASRYIARRENLKLIYKENLK